MEAGTIVSWANYGEMLVCKCKVCGAKGFLTKNIGGPLKEDGTVGHLGRSLHVVEMDAMICDQAGHKLTDLQILEEDNQAAIGRYVPDQA